MIYSKKIFSFLLFVFTVSATEPYLIFTPHNAFYSAATKSLGDAVSSYPVDITSGLINPALIFSYLNKKSTITGNVSVGYGRDSIFDRHIVPAGIAYSTGDGAIGGYYRYLKNDNHKTQNEFVVNMSGVLFGPAKGSSGTIEAGQVDFGINIRYELLQWENRPLGPFNDLGAISNAQLEEKRLLLDAGLYQSNVAKNLDFALTMKNMAGYIWTEEKPVVKDSVEKQYLPNSDSVVNTVYYYVNSTKKSKEWIKKTYRAITVGATYHILLGESISHISIPVDCEILGLFTKKVKNVYIFRSGIDLVIKDKFSIRAGYSRAPEFYQRKWKKIKKINVFTGCVGITISPAKIDCYFADKSFGTTAAFEF
jgi:hypothetical protein